MPLSMLEYPAISRKQLLNSLHNHTYTTKIWPQKFGELLGRNQQHNYIIYITWGGVLFEVVTSKIGANIHGHYAL